MSESVTSPNYIELCADIVSAYVSNNSVPAADLPVAAQFCLCRPDEDRTGSARGAKG